LAAATWAAIASAAIASDSACSWLVATETAGLAEELAEERFLLATLTLVSVSRAWLK